MVRCTTSSDRPRHSFTFTPYFFSNASASGCDSVGASDVYSVRLPSRFAASARRATPWAPRSADKANGTRAAPGSGLIGPYLLSFRPLSAVFPRTFRTNRPHAMDAAATDERSFDMHRRLPVIAGVALA